MTKHTWLKKLGGLLLAVSLLCSMIVAVPAEETDLLQAGSWAEDWTLTPSVEGGASLTEEDGAAVITVTEGSAVFSKDTKNSLAYNNVYEIRFSYKTENMESGSAAKMVMYRADGTTEEAKTNEITADSNGWKTLSVVMKSGIGESKKLQFVLTGKGVLSVKDVTVIPYTGENLFYNGNAENIIGSLNDYKTGTFSTAKAYDGISSFSGDKKARMTGVNVTGGKTYRISFAFYSDTVAKPRIQFLYNHPGAGAASEKIFGNCTAGEWTEYTYYLSVPETYVCSLNGCDTKGTAEAVTSMYMFLRTDGDAVQTIFYDAITVTEADAGFMTAENGDAAFAAGETITAFTIVEADKSGTALVALYKKNGDKRTLVGLQAAPITAAEAMQAATVNYTLPTMDTGEYTLAVYAWNMQSGIAPLKDAYTHTWTVQ